MYKKNIWLLGLISLFTDIGSQMVYPLIPQLLQGLGAGATMLGLVEGIAEAAAALFRGVFGRLSDRLGRQKRFIFLGYGLSNLIRPLFAVAGSVGVVVGLRFLERMGKALRVPARDAMLAHSAGAGRKGRAFGIHRSMDRIGSLLGPLLAGIILWASAGNIRLVFLLAVIPGLLSFLFIPWLKEEAAVPAPPAQAHGWSMRGTDFPRAFWWLMAVNTLFGLANASNAFLILKAGTTGLTAPQIPLLWAFYNAVCALSSPLLGHLSDRWSRRRMLALSFLLFSLLYAGLAAASESWQIWLLFGVLGIHYGLSKGIMPAFLSDLIPDSPHLATAFGLLDMVSAISVLMASVIMGLLWDTLGSATAFGFGAAISALALVLFLLRVPPVSQH
ncbi:MAG: MFS transporter [Haliscomenobacter sp.]